MCCDRDRIDELVAALTDDRRHGLAFVAGSDLELDIPFDTWAKQVGKWAKEVSGLGKVFVLDPAATADFARRVGPQFAAPPWAIRTYRPDVRLGDSEQRTPASHPGHQTVGQTNRYWAIRTLLGDIARQQAGTRPPDPSVLRVQRRFERLENRRLVEHLAEPSASCRNSVPRSGSGASDSARPQAGRGQAARTGQEDPRSGRDHRALVDIVPRQADATRPRAQGSGGAQGAGRLVAVPGRGPAGREPTLVEALDDAQLETELVRLDMDDRDGKIRWLTARLKEHDDYEAEYADVPEEYKQSRPDDFDDLLDRIEQLDGVCFTGDAKEVARLAQVDTNDVALRAAWDAVLVMCDYVRLRADGSWTQGLKQFIDHTPQGCHTISSRKFAETETGTTMRQFGDERLFSVPEDVESGGTVTMKAHFKLAKIGHVSPRMYIHDAHPDHSMMCIGYIGLHLTNTQT